ncbi:flagellar transcriptional regulator FlhD [Burkholderia sp. RF2-non_BP3]|uniref:flagellar transcriptional regulator FlhD n=1 Tax=Burkholderia sp. RF2-non_BP3 TaxID=1637844 RepID=UPI000ADDA88E|nr:flagellar transcriptional regulator FlhD [Burkholderia sp. RF2-non_BP3]
MPIRGALFYFNRLLSENRQLMFKQVICIVKQGILLCSNFRDVSIGLNRYQSRCNMGTINEEESIRDLNLSYLWLAQRLLQTDRATGMFRLGATPEMAGTLESLTMRSMMSLSSSGQLLCVLRLSRYETVAALARPESPGDAVRLHTAMALSSLGAFDQDAP